MSASKSKHQGENNKARRESVSRWQASGICFALAALTFAVFGQALTHEFIDYDDNDYVFENPVVRQGFTPDGLVWAFRGIHAHNWHPLTWLSHELDCQLYGLHPGGHHLTSVLLHTATVIVLFLVLRQMTGAVWRCAFVAAVFAIHPLRVESVAWVAERKDVLSGLFFVLTIAAYVRYARRPGSRLDYAWVMALFALGLMCKPMLVTLPVVLLLLDYWPLRRTESPRKLVMEKLPLLALSLAAGIATLWAQHGAIQTAGSFSLPTRLANAMVTCLVYLGQMVYPVGLAAFYPYPSDGLPVWEVALGGMLLAGISWLAFAQRRKRPWLLVGWGWYLVVLLPVLGIIQVGVQAHADRYTYLSQIGIYVGISWLVAEWRINRLLLAGLMAGVVGVLTICARNQAAYWKNGETLWTHALACTTRNDVAHFGLGNVLLQKERWDDAIAQFQQALQIRPDIAETHYDLGVSLAGEGKDDAAMSEYRRALEIKPDYAEAFYNLGVCLQKQGQLDQAISQYQKSAEFKPDSAGTHNNLGVALVQEGRTDEAIEHFQKAVQVAPNNTDSLINLGTALLGKGKVDEAAALFQKALEIDANSADAHYGLGNVFMQKRKTAEAIAQFQMSLQVKPANPEVQNNLAWLLATCSPASLRNGYKAVDLARQASALTGGKNPIILHTLAAALAETGQFADAVQMIQKAIELAEKAGQKDLATQFNDELKHYQAGFPLHQ